MPFATPSVQQFRDRFPEFADPDTYPDGRITALLAEAEGGVGRDWMERDYQPALMYLAAHLLSTEEWQISIAQSGGGGASEGVGAVKSISVGDRTVTYETRPVSNTSSGGETADASEYASTFYGQQYLRLLRRNVVGVVALGT